MRRPSDQTSFGRQTLSPRQPKPIFASVARRRPMTGRVLALAALTAASGVVVLLFERRTAGAALLLGATLVVLSAFVRRRR